VHNEDILELIGKASLLPSRDHTILKDEFLEELRSRNRPLVLLVTGGEKSGKSTILKALFPELSTVLPVDEQHDILILNHGIKTFIQKKEELGIPVTEISLRDERLRFITVIESPLSVSKDVFWYQNWKHLLLKADRCLFVSYAGKPLASYELEFVREHLGHMGAERILFTLHKVDQVDSTQELLDWVLELRTAQFICSEVMLSSVNDKTGLGAFLDFLQKLLLDPSVNQDLYHRLLYGLRSGIMTLELKLSGLKSRLDGCGRSEEEIAKKLENLNEKQEHLKHSFMAFSEGLEQEFSEHMQELSTNIGLERQLILSLLTKSVADKSSLSRTGTELVWILRYALEKHKPEIQSHIVNAIGKIRESTLSLCKLLAETVHTELDFPLDTIRKVLDSAVQEMVNDWLGFTHQELDRLFTRMPDLKNSKSWQAALYSQKQKREKMETIIEELNHLLTDCFAAVELSLRQRFLPAAEAIWKKLAQDLQRHTEVLRQEMESLRHTRDRQKEIRVSLKQKVDTLQTILKEWKSLAQLTQSHRNRLQHGLA